MSVDMAVWEGSRPASDASALQTYQSLYEQYMERERPTEPTAKIKELVATLLATFPDLDTVGADEIDDSPWAVGGSLLEDASGPFTYFAMARNEAAERAWGLATRRAAQLDLVAFDRQSGRLA